MPFKKPVEPDLLPGVVSAFDAAADYAFSLGVNRNNVRLAAYREFLHSISDGDDSSLKSENAIRFWREIHEITWVLTVFKSNPLNTPRDLLIRALNGKPLEEYEHDAGRNLFLELRAAIYFLRVGYQVSLGEQCDVVATRKKHRIFIEYKRIYSERKANDRVNQCYEQLEKRLSNADRKYSNLGLAWIDPSPAMQQYFFLYTAYSEAGARNAARMDLVFFWKEWIAKAYSGCDKRIFALLLQMIWPSWIAHSQGVRTGFTSYVVPAHARVSIFGLFKARRLLDELLDVEGA